MIAWYDNVPVLSFLILQGKCRHCKKPISWTYPAIELITAGLFVWWYLIGFTFFQLSSQPFALLQPAFWLFVGICLIIIFFSDILYGVIPDSVVIALTGLAFLYRVMLYVFHVMQPVDFWFAMLSGVASSAFFFGLWYGTKKRGMGFGDVKFVFPLGLLLGWPQILVGLFSAFVVGAVVSVALVVWKKKEMKQTVPFGPFLITGTVIALVFGDKLVQWYLSLL
jgi:prepilin signal peptidase PulO-like enzyme (type II secretory pathway)